MTTSMRLTRGIWISAITMVVLAVGLAGWVGYLIGSKDSSTVAQNSSPVPVEPSPVVPVYGLSHPQSKTPPTKPESRTAHNPKDDPSPVRPPIENTIPEVKPDPPRIGVLQPRVNPPGNYKKGDVINQEVVFTRKSLFRTAGVEVGQGAQYGITSSIEIVNVNDDGSMIAEQTIRKAKLIDADQDMKALLAAALDKIQNTKFKLTVNPNGEVTSLAGLKDPIRIQAGKEDAMGQSLRLWSLLDADAWKELAGLMLFQPEKPLKAKVTWNKPVTHDWSPLGNWQGNTVYLAAGKQPGKTNLERIQYGHEIYYKPPVAGADMALPFRVLKADFKTVMAGGVILYDPNSHRTTAAEETFHVRGAVQVSFGGIDTVIEMEERQGFRLIVKESEERVIVGRPSRN